MHHVVENMFSNKFSFLRFLIYVFLLGIEQIMSNHSLYFKLMRWLAAAGKLVVTNQNSLLNISFIKDFWIRSFPAVFYKWNFSFWNMFYTFFNDKEIEYRCNTYRVLLSYIFRNRLAFPAISCKLAVCSAILHRIRAFVYKFDSMILNNISNWLIEQLFYEFITHLWLRIYESGPTTLLVLSFMCESMAVNTWKITVSFILWVLIISCRTFIF